MGKKILLADDSITIQKVIELTFSDEDFDVTTVGNGRLAIEKAQELRPDIILCDIIMPEKDGYEVCDFVKKSTTLGHVPVLLLTGAFEPFDQDRASRVGCDGFLAKPFEPQTLIAKVKDLLAQAGTRSVPATSPRPLAPPPPLTPPPPLEAPSTVRVSSTTPASFAPVTPPPPSPGMSSGGGAFIPDEPVIADPDPPSVEVAEMFAAPSMPMPAYEPAPVYAPPAYEPPPVYEARPAAYEPAPVFEPPTPVVVEPEAPEVFAEVAPMDAFAAPTPAEEPELYAVEEPVETAMPAPVVEAVPPVMPPPSESPSDTVFFRSAGGWSQPTLEVPLEDRAQASVESAQAAAAAEPVFEEVFDELHEAHTAELPAEPETRPLEEVEPAPAPVPVQAVMPTPETIIHHEESFADIRPLPAVAPPAAEPSSNAAEVAVPVEMVSQIAQRVVAQISEKVIREIAWEVIPELAENLIKKEIARLKAELQQT
jgi:CheY-like chemotaxis protein